LPIIPRSSESGGRSRLSTAVNSPRAAELRAEIDTWTQRVAGPQLPPAILLRGVIFWSRLHGLVSHELDATWPRYRSDPELLYRAEPRRVRRPDLMSTRSDGDGD
jgi:hypothetical protein